MKKTAILLAALSALPAIANAHPGSGAAHGFSHGFQHPIFGLDHLLAMIAVGLWAVQTGGRAVWAIPLAFVGTMALGGAIGMADIPLPLIESGIATSVLLLGLLLVFAVRLPLAAATSLVALFAIFHGHAHGSEMPADASGVLYGAGFLLATIALHATGITLGIRDVNRAPITRLAGAGVAMAGVALILA